MNCLFLLSKENLELARAELLSLVQMKHCAFSYNLVLGDTKEKKSFKRLAYTKAAYQFLFETTRKKLASTMKQYDWQSVYKDSFSLHKVDLSKKTKLNLKTYANYIWDSIKRPEVDLENAKTKIVLLVNGEQIICGKVLWENDTSFEQRKAHKRPGFAPVSLHPKLARAAVNLSGIKDGAVCDPFCGTGGILIEAGLMKFQTKGFDIDEEMIEKSKENLKYFKVKDAKLKVADALKLKGTYDAVVTDLPYGKNTGKMDVQKLTDKFLKHAKKLTDNLVLMTSSSVEPDTKGWNVTHHFTIKLQRGLYKQVLVLRK